MDFWATRRLFTETYYCYRYNMCPLLAGRSCKVKTVEFVLNRRARVVSPLNCFVIRNDDRDNGVERNKYVKSTRAVYYLSPLGRVGPYGTHIIYCIQFGGYTGKPRVIDCALLIPSPSLRVAVCIVK